MSKTTGAQAHIDLLGKTAKDKVTGFTGTVSSVSFDLYGCIQAALTPTVDKDGKTQDGHWFDIHRLALLSNDRVMNVPAFAMQPPTFGARPETHTHGPAEKPTTGRRS